jgi:hypothetical protein
MRVGSSPRRTAPTRRVLREQFSDYYHPAGTHLSPGGGSPIPRPVQPPQMGEVVSFPILGGLHHRYERRGACTVQPTLWLYAGRLTEVPWCGWTAGHSVESNRPSA